MVGWMDGGMEEHGWLFHQLFYRSQLPWKAKGGEGLETIFTDIFCPVLEFPVFDHCLVVVIECLDHARDIFLDYVPELDTVVPVVVARQVHHAPVLEIFDVVKVVPVHVLESLRQKFLDSVRAMANRQTAVSTSSRTDKNLAAEGVDGDDEPEVLLEHLVDGVGGHEAALHREGKRLHKEMRVRQVGAYLGRLNIDMIIISH